ncbi:MAG: hypothetical protein HOP31_17085 [Ignavibacteria bacterium]|nr:hypothetical protein [Ignavibacteria bacterium]
MNLFQTEDKINEYLIIISPPAETKEQIRQIKNEFALKTNSKHAAESVAHISVLGLILESSREEKLKPFLKEFCAAQVPFSIYMKNYNGFPSHTIFISILEIDNIVKMMNNLFMFLKKNQIILKKNYQRHTLTHISIARLLTKDQYSKVITEYQNKPFTGMFIANNLTLLKRPYDRNSYNNYRWDKDKYKFTFSGKNSSNS